MSSKWRWAAGQSQGRCRSTGLTGRGGTAGDGRLCASRTRHPGPRLTESCGRGAGADGRGLLIVYARPSFSRRQSSARLRQDIGAGSRATRRVPGLWGPGRTRLGFAGERDPLNPIYLAPFQGRTVWTTAASVVLPADAVLLLCGPTRFTRAGTIISVAVQHRADGV